MMAQRWFDWLLYAGKDEPGQYGENLNNPAGRCDFVISCDGQLVKAIFYWKISGASLWGFSPIFQFVFLLHNPPV